MPERFYSCAQKGDDQCKTLCWGHSYSITTVPVYSRELLITSESSKPKQPDLAAVFATCPTHVANGALPSLKWCVTLSNHVAKQQFPIPKFWLL